MNTSIFPPQSTWRNRALRASAAVLLMGGIAFAEPVSIVVHADQPGASISPLFYGMMTEELNHSYDGGLYADLIQNRNFRQVPFVPPKKKPANAFDPGAAPEQASREARTNAPEDYLIHWSLVQSEGAAGKMAIDLKDPVNAAALAHSLRLDIAKVAGGQRVGVANAGYWGIPVKPDTTYTASFYVRASEGFHGPLTASIESPDGRTVYASATVDHLGASWKKESLTLRTGKVAPTSDARFVLSAGSPGSIWLSLVSLMPPTYSATLPFRPDLMEKLVALHSAFLRFPGGAYVAGENAAERWAWKTTIGPAEQRPGHMNSAWDYWASDGMGMLEFLRWCEAMNAEPVLVLHTGFMFSRRSLGAGPELDSLVQEGLDAIEYAIGDTSTKWGAERARNGHPAPFQLNYVQIGNEEERGGAQTYPERFTAFHDAIKARYPDLKLISGMQHAEPNLQMPRRPDLVDDHFYFDTIADALVAARAYDSDRYSRKNPGVFVGEYATRLPQGGDTGNMLAACGDAAFLIGLERNADIVAMTTYAPLFTNISPGASKWPVNLIGYNALSSFVSPSYYVQRLFATNRGDTVLPATVKNAPKLTAKPDAPDAVVAGASRVNADGDIVLKLVNVQETPQPIEVEIEGISQILGDARVEAISGAPTAVNTISQPDTVLPRQATVPTKGTKFSYEMPATSVSLIRVKVR